MRGWRAGDWVAKVRRLMLAVAVVTGLFATALSAPANATYVGRDGKLAFVRGDDIYTVASAGGVGRRLTADGKNVLPKWSPDGTHIAYIHQKPSGARDVWVMLASGSARTRVTFVGNVTSAPTWSPDGKLLAFAAGASDTLGQLYEIGGRAPFGSPTQVQGYRTGCRECVPVDPTDLHPISVDRFLAWSPDGSRIALFNHDDARFDDAIWMYYVGTREIRQYDVTGADCCGYIDWSDLAWGPGGDFGYTAAVTGELDGATPYLHVVYPGFTPAEGDRYPAPSPAGTRIAFTNAASGPSTILIATATGAGRRVVTSGYQPDWQPLP